MDIDQITRECKAMHGSGVSSELIVEHMRCRGLTIIQSIKLLREVLDISLGESKLLVTKHPAWHLEAEAGEKLHDEIERIL